MQNTKQCMWGSEYMIQASKIINWIYDEALADKHTLSRDSEQIWTCWGIEPRAVENFATAPHRITAVQG